MKRKTRTIFFLFLLILFLIAAPLTVFYSLGWRFDWKTKEITQPGIFYFKVWPRNVQIYLDGKPKKKTDFFFGSILIENLLPKKHEVEIKKEGFHNWKKTLEIRKRQVTEAKNIILIPEEPKFTIISGEVENFFFSPDEKKIILQEKSDSDSENSSWALKLFETERNVKSHLIEEKDISLALSNISKDKKKEIQLINLKFSSDSKRVLLELGLKENLNPQTKQTPSSEQTNKTSERYYYILEINKVPPVLTSFNFSEAEKIYFYPKEPQKLLVLSSLTDSEEKAKKISEVNLTDEKISSPVLENVITCSVSNDNIHYLDTSGFLFKTDPPFNQKERLNIIPFSLKKEAEYKITGSDSHIFLKEDDILYIFDESKKSFQEIFEPVEDSKLSPDSRKLVFLNDYEVWVLFLEKEYEQPQKEIGEQSFITRFSEKIDEVFWYTNHYLIFNIRGKIKIAEIDDRDKINIIELAEFQTPKIFWNQKNKKLYVLTERNFYSSEKLVP